MGILFGLLDIEVSNPQAVLIGILDLVPLKVVSNTVNLKKSELQKRYCFIIRT